MKIQKAKAVASLFYLLFRLKLLSEKRYDHLVNYLTVRVLADEIKERQNGSANKEP